MSRWPRSLKKSRRSSPRSESTGGPPAATIVAGYASRFDRALSDDTQSVASPLGAWLLLALVAPAATGVDRDELEAALGTGADDAARIAHELLGAPHPAVFAALALWHRDELLQPSFHDWMRTMPEEIETGRVPSQVEADAWAARTTRDLIAEFPIELDQRVAIVLANALGTRVRWRDPFALAPAELLAGPWSERVATVLWDRLAENVMLLTHTERAGDVAVHAAHSPDRLTVVSVIAATDVPTADVRAAAHEVAIGIARGGARSHSLFDLPLGDGHSWTITEYEAPVDEGAARESYEAFLPAWTATSGHDLLAGGPALGFPAAGRTLGRFVAEPDADPFEARQVAAAAFHQHGFDAAAVSSMMSRSLSAMVSNPVRKRRASLRFGHPYAVVAVATEVEDGPWHGVPVFSAWVADPAEPEEAAGRFRG